MQKRKLLTTVSDCIEAIELAVNWSAERLYGVEGIGPFYEAKSRRTTESPRLVNNAERSVLSSLRDSSRRPAQTQR